MTQDAVVRSEYKQVRIGLAGLGLRAYWSQFAGLEARLLRSLAAVEEKVSRFDRVIFNLGLIDTPERALEAGHACRRNDIDVLLIYVATYALSATVLPLVLRARVPVILLNLQPAAAIDYQTFNKMEDGTAMTGEWLAYCSSCPVPEIANVFKRIDIPFRQVTGMLHDDPECWTEIEEWLCAAAVAYQLSHCRLGLLGHYYGGMLDIATDLTQVSGRFGVHVEMLEVDELSSLCQAVEDDANGLDRANDAVRKKLEGFAEFFAIEEDCSEAELHRAAVTAVALDRFVEKNDLGMLAYYYKGTGVRENEMTMCSVIPGMSMLTGRGIPTAGEYEVKNVIAMKIMDLLGAGGSFTEYYAVDFTEDVVLMGHDGPGHPRMAEGKLKLRPLRVYHGKVGSGLSVEMSVKHGPVTLLSVVEDRERGFRLQVAEGESVAGPILEIGNTNSRYRFALGARRFVEAWNSHGPAHHCAVGLGHRAGVIEKLASLLGLGFVAVH